ncbi:hypothetical protein AB0P21_09665 [Kribbella sp. NPDC056861]|uniref:hypothetical protein n=1 Tax=Kribbella sp. NPDC056861 TaxID=3154857 RepID=UPI00343E3A09
MKKRSLGSFLPQKDDDSYASHQGALLWSEAGYEAMIKTIASGIDGYTSVMDQFANAEDGPIDENQSVGIGQILHGFVGLLNGDIGRFNATCLDSWARYNAALVGYCLNHQDMAYNCRCGVDRVREEAGV